MKRKTALIVGLAAGYVLGARAGRERFEQIERGFSKVWESKPVVKCRGAVKSFLGEKASNAQSYVIKKGKGFLHAVTEPEKDKK